MGKDEVLSWLFFAFIMLIVYLEWNFEQKEQ